jgi:hypothetical protein
MREFFLESLVLLFQSIDIGNPDPQDFKFAIDFRLLDGFSLASCTPE